MMVVLGVGNTMMRDDGIGVRAVQALTQAYILPKSVRVVEGGVAGIRLLPFIQDADDLLIVDAVRGLGAPGTIYRLDVTELPMGWGAARSCPRMNSGLPSSFRWQICWEGFRAPASWVFSHSMSRPSAWI